MNAMWKPNQPGTSPTSPSDPIRPQTPTPLSPEPAAQRPNPTPSSSTTEQATIGKSLTIKGEITGSEGLYIDGHVEGSVNLPGNRVVVGRNGQVSANISAREVVVLGKVNGNINASDRVDIRNEGSLTGDVVAQRISIEDGAYFKGGIDIRKPAASEVKASEAAKSAVATPAHV
jgi:cytoskeletal protein CcmA (bactofilin family)